MRERLTKRAHQKRAELTDPNQLGREDRKNPELKKYETHKFVENHPLPDMSTQWKKDKRNEVGLPAPITAAQKAAALRKAKQERERFKAEVNKKAEACLKIAELLLPGVDEKIAEDQAVELMDLPTPSIINLLRRKYELLEKDAAAGIPDGTGPRGGTPSCPMSEKKQGEEEEEKKEEGKEEEEEEKKEGGEEMKEEGKEEEKEAGEEEEEEIEVTSSDEDAILDQIFADNEEVKEAKQAKQASKTGAKKLGNVKKASVGGANLEKLWKSDPDVSDAFGL